MMGRIREWHTAWSAYSVCLLAVFLFFQNPAFAEINSVLLNPSAAENGKYTVVEISGIQNTAYFPCSINNLGQVVGYSITPGGYCRAFLWTESAGASNLGTFGPDPASIAYGINDVGQIVGESFPLPYNLGRAVLKTGAGVMTQFATPAGAISISNSGVVCGTGQRVGYSGSQPFMWSASQGIQFIGNLGGNGYFNVARHINNSNQIVGGSSNDSDGYTHAYLWSQSYGIQDLGTLPGDMVSVAECINDSGQVVGWSRNLESAGTPDKAFIWSPQDGMTELPPLRRFTNTEAFGINKSGTVVGTSRPLKLNGNWQQHAVIWLNDSPIDLNELIDGQALGCKLTCAVAINDQGQIIAVSDSCYNVPEPAAVYSGGTGQSNNPYQIATKADLLTLAGNPGDYNKFFILTENIDLSGEIFTQAVIAPDADSVASGFQSTLFTGNFDGDGYVISNLTIAASGQEFVGLFGYVGLGGQISYLGIENINIIGNDYVGGMMGFNGGTITSCYVTGSVGASNYVGGMAGYNQGTLNSCYATGSVSGSNYAGGMVGYNYQGKVIQCYSTAKPAGNLNVGGLCGSKYTGGNYEDTGNFWDIQTSQKSTSAMGLGKTTVQMKTLSTFTLAGWNFSATDGDWQMPANSYPQLAWKIVSVPLAPTGVAAADGTYTDKAQISWVASGTATSYEIWRNTANASGSASKIGDDTASPYDDTSALAGTTYWYWVKAKNTGGTSGFSNGDSGYRAVLPPPAPTGVSATDGTYTDKARISWVASGTATSYEIWRNTANASGSASKIGDDTVSPYDDTSVLAGTTYWYWVKAKNTGGISGFSNGDSGYKIVCSLPNAIDQPSLIITTGGSGNWLGQTDSSANGVDSARSGVVTHLQESWMQTTVSGITTIKFNWKVSSEANYDFLEFYIDGVLKEKISGNVDWTQKSYTVTGSSHTLKWRYIKDKAVSTGSDCGWVDKVELVPAGITLQEAVDNPPQIITTGGSANWLGQTDSSANGADSARSGVITHLQESWMQTTVSGITTIKFNWKVSSEVNYDFLEFYIDGVLKDKISSTNVLSWTQKVYTVTNGSHTLKWRYVKDQTVSVGDDCGWVDKLEVF